MSGRITTLAQARRLIKIVFAFTLLVVGAAMLVLPGPGLLVIGAGLAILSGEFVWAKRLLDRLKSGARRAQDAVSRHSSPRP